MRALDRLNPRERLLVLAVLPVAAVAAGYSFGWLPLQSLRLDREAEIAGYRLIVQSAAEAEARPDGTTAAPQADAAPFAARVTASAEAAGLALSRLEPEGDRLRVTVGDAEFASVVLWLADLEETRDVTLAAIEMDRRVAPGTVSARVLLEPAR